MMQFRVTGGTAKFGPGQKFELTPAQIVPRMHVLDMPKGYSPTEKKAKAAEVTSTALVEFKAGEVIGLPDEIKALANVLELVSIEKTEPDHL